MTNEYYYERLYKKKGEDEVFAKISVDKDSPLFYEFPEEDVKYWIEDEPKRVKFEWD